MTEIFTQLFVLAILIILSALFSGSEVALLSVNQIKVRTFLKERRKGAEALSRLKRNPRRMIIAILIGNNVANILAAAITTLMATEQLGSFGLGIATGILTLVILIFGEITPKTFASTHADKISLAIATPIEILSYLLFPVVLLLELISDKISKLAKVEKSEPITESEIRTMIEYGVEKNVIEPEASYLMKRALKFSDIKTHDIITPVNRIFSLNGNLTVKQSFRKIINSGYSRIPIYQKSKSNIVGIILRKDLIGSEGKIKYDKKLKDIAIDPIFAPKNMQIHDLLKVFQAKQTHIAIVRDGKKLLGLVTLEDLLEELVGEITDEKDITPSTIIRINKNTIVAHGETLVERINRFFNTSLPVKRKDIMLYELIRQYLKRPKKYSKLKIYNLTLLIEDMREDKILKVRLIKKIEPISRYKKDKVVSFLRKALRI